MFNKINNKLKMLFIIISFMLVVSPVVFADNTVDNDNIIEDNVVSDDAALNDNTLNEYDNGIEKEKETNMKKDGGNTIYVSPNGGGSGSSLSDTTYIDDALSKLDDNGTVYLTAEGDNNLYQLYEVGINHEVLKNTTINVNIVGDSKSNIHLKSTYFMLDIRDVNLTIRNVNFVDSYSPYYMGVIISQLSNVSFINCSFINYTGSYDDASFIYSVYSNMTFTNCTFRDSNLSNGSSFISCYVRRVMGEYINNLPVQYYSYTNMKFTNNIFVNNTASCNSNLLFFDCADSIEFYNNRFENNTAVNGLIRSYLGFNDSFIKNTFINNDANCLYLAYSDGIVKSNVFKNNKAPMAAGILMVNGEYNLTDNKFVNNHVDTFGGAIVNLGYYQINMTKCIFDNNSALYGGAIYNVYDCLNVTNSNFTSNKATLGGALYYMFNDTKITALSFNPDIPLNNPNIVKNSLFESNTADEGNVLYIIRSNVQFNENAVYNKKLDENLITIKENASVNLDENWWGCNNPNYGVLTAGFIPDNWIIMNFTNTSSLNPINLKVSLNRLNDNKQFNGNIPQRLVQFAAKTGNFKFNQSMITKTLTNTYNGTDIVYATIDNEKLQLNAKQELWMSVADVKTVANKTVTITINTVNDLKNNITVYVNNKLIKNVKANNSINVDYFVGNAYKTANYTINIYYAGDSKYLAKNMTARLEVINIDKNTINNIITPLITKKSNYTTDLPAKYDPRITNSTTPLTNQGNSGSCWVFSSINTLQECIKKQTNQTYDFSENNAKNNIAKYSIIGDNEKTPNDGGSGIEMISYMVGWYGPIPESTDGYADYSVISPLYNSSYHVQDVIFIPERKKITDINQIKEAIYNYGAVQVVYCAGSIDTNIYHNIYYEDNHGATLVGWDDNYDKNNFQAYDGDNTVTPKSNGAFILKNSWGGGFADDGYQYLSYYDLTYGGFNDTNGYNLELYAYLLNNTPEYSNIYQYDALSTQKIPFTDKARMKNKYIADKEETLAAVGTYFIDKSSYKLKIYINGKLMHTQQNNITQKGYRTITLTKYYLLNANDEMTIEMEIKSLERNTTEIYYQYKENHNENYHENLSYISYDGNNWLDCYEYLNKGAIALKAYTLETPVIDTTTKTGNNTLTIKTTIRNNDKPANITYILNGKTLKDSNDKIVKIAVNSNTTKTTTVNIGDLSEYTLKTIYTSEEYKIEEVTSFVKNNTTLSIKTNNSKPCINDQITITVQLLSDNTRLKNQNISLTVGNKNYTLLTDNNGNVNISIKLQSAGNQTITAKYLGNSNYNGCNATSTFNVQKITPIITLNATTPSVVGDKITITLAVKDSNNKAVTGSITIKLDDKNISTLNLSGGKATTTTTASSGTHNITVVYNANNIYNQASKTTKIQVNKLNTTLTLTVNNTSPRVNDKIKVTVTLKDSKNKLLTNQNISLQINKKTYTLTTNNKATATYIYTLTKNDKGMNITAKYNGNNTHNPVNKSLNINRKYKVDMELLTGSFDSKPGDTVKLIAHIKDNGVDIDGGQLVFKLNGVSLRDDNGSAVVVSIKNGLAVLEYKIPDTLGARTHNLTAVYASNTYGRVELTTPMTINKYYTHIDVNPVYTTTSSIQVKAQVVDQNNQALNKQTIMCIKLNGKSYSFNTTTGTINYKITQTLKDGYYNMTIISGENGKYLGATVKTVLIKSTAIIKTNYINNTLNTKTTSKSGDTKTSNIMSILTGSSTVKPGDRLKLIAHLSEDQVDINGGQLVFKLNGVSLKDENGNAVVVNIEKGLGILDYKIPDTLGARTHNLTAVYASKKYGRVELTASLTMNRLNTHIEADPIFTSSATNYVQAKILDDNNQLINKQTSVVVKIDGKSYSFNTTTGTINYKVPTTLSKGLHQVTIIAGENGKYIASRANTVLIKT